MKKKLLTMLLAFSLLLGNAPTAAPVYALGISTQTEINHDDTPSYQDSDEDPSLPEDILEEDKDENSEDSDGGAEDSPEFHQHTCTEWTTVTPATAGEDGLETGICTECQEVVEQAISHPHQIILSKEEYSYNKKEHRPKVQLLDAEGNTISDENYTLVYTDNVMPGKATVTITLDNDRYDVRLKSHYQIVLTPLALTQVTARTEGFLAEWEAQTRYITGYQLQYSTSKDFTEDCHKKKISPRKANSKIISKLESKTRYYVRIRSFMETEDKTYYSDWSEAVKVKTKETKILSLLAVGDDLLHSPVYKSCKTKKGYNFKPMFANIKEDIQAADLAVINQETILVSSNYSSYPCFGSPYAVADAIADTGFDIVTCATNHTMDRGTSSIEGTMKYWAKHYPDVTLLGVHDSKEDAAEITVVEKNGIKLALLNYTYGLNGIRLPSDKSYMIDLLSSKERIRSQISKAKKISDLVIVFPHWGTEYVYSPDNSQKNWAQFFADEGVDLVIGTHPHVLEPIKKVTGKNGNVMICYYSLGNFISAQGKVPRALGGMADVTIVKDSDGTRVKNADMIPLVTHMTNGSRPYTVYKLADYTDELARTNHLRNRTSEVFTVKKLKELYKYIMSR